jgi:hypothetical protein
MIVSPITAALLMWQATSSAPKKPAPPAPKAAAAATQKSTDIGVTVTYKGKGAVDASHKIIVFAFTDPNVTSSSRPVATEFAATNGATVAFKGITSPIYVFAVYDEKGNYDGLSGPPPPGTPSATYSKTPKGPPTAVGPGTPIKFAFDDSSRWNK